MRIATEVFLVLALELLGKVGDETVVEILATEMGVTSCGLHFEDAFLDGEKRNIKCPTAEIEDEDIALASGLLIETVGNGGGGGFVDDTEDVHTGNGSGILGGLTLRIVEVSGDGDDSVGHCGAKVRLRSLLHLKKDHG